MIALLLNISQEKLKKEQHLPLNYILSVFLILDADWQVIDWLLSHALLSFLAAWSFMVSHVLRRMRVGSEHHAH